MTDKQIIINGIDVRGCKNFRPDADTSEISYTNACSIGLWQRWYSNLEPSCTMSCRCRDNPDCHYKLYKRKEQECETLASQLDFEVQKKECLEQECERLKKEVEFYTTPVKLGDYKPITLIIEELDQLKAENEELKQAHYLAKEILKTLGVLDE